MKCFFNTIIIFMLALFVPSIASANAGVPMIFLTYPAMLAALIPIILIESVAIRFLLKSEWRETIIASTSSNAVSTIVGIPITWGVFLLFEMAVGISAGHFDINPNPILGTILFAAWLGPDENNLNWMIPLSSMVLLVGYFYTSYWIEKIVGKKYLKKNSSDEIGKAFWHANIITYGILEFIAAIFLFQAI